MSDKQTGYIVSHTHWDREWRVPEWNARRRLEIMMDKLLDKLRTTPEFSFLFDGQVVSIEDYLELHPEKRDEICGYVKANRLQIGPWYNLPDLYPVCGEALVRNLLIGRKRAQQLGGCLDIAYTTFGWGQTAQFPQIFDGFGIKRIVCAKNVSKERAPDSEFIWESPDGTRIFTTRLGIEKRANFFFFCLMPASYGTKYMDKNTCVKWGKGGWIWHSADKNTDSELSFVPDWKFHPEVMDYAIKEVWATGDESLASEHHFMGNGCDSTTPSDITDEIIEYVNANYPDKLLKYSTLGEYFDVIEHVIKSRNIELKTVYGELRDGPVHSLSANALATRMPLKTLNRSAQDSLIRYGEPIAALASIFGAQYPQAFLDKAWHFMLLAHSHDALNGVTLDKTARDTVNKFDQVCEIGQVVTDMSAEQIMKRIDMSDCRSGDIMLAVFNLSSQPQRQIMHAAIDVPEDIHCRRLKAADVDGSGLTVQPIDHKSMQLPVCVENSRALPYYADRHTMYLDTGVVPALGYKVIKLIPDETYKPEVQFWLGTYEHGSQVCGLNRMANRYIDVSINSDGTFNVTDKSSGRKFESLGSFEDGGDVGDYWQRVEPASNRVYSSAGCSTDIYLACDGPLLTQYVCEQVMTVPRQAARDGRFKSSRSDDAAMLRIKTTLTLKAASRYLEIDVEVDNTAKDHRLRMCMPTGIKTAHSDAQGHYNVDRRPIGRDYINGKRDGQMSTLPMQNFVDLSDEMGGVAFLNKNLIEFEVSENDSRIVYLTLLRCIDVKICTEGRCGTIETGAEGPQCLGWHKFSLAVYPHAGNWQDCGIYNVMENYVMPPRMYQVSKTSGGDLPMSMSMLEITNRLVQLSCVKKSESGEGLIIRIYNPTGDAQKCGINFAAAVISAFATDMAEGKLSALNVCDGRKVCLELSPYKIMTMLIEFDKERYL